MTGYILEVLFWQALLLLIYKLLLGRERMFTLNRIYLLLAPLVAFVLPLIRLRPPAAVQQWTLRLPAIMPDSILPGDMATGPGSHPSVTGLIYTAGVVISLALLGLYLYRIRRLIKENEVLEFPDYTLVLLHASQKAFSFLRYIFMDRQWYGTPLGAHIIEHEKVHIRLKHSWDLLYLEVLKSFFWFSPFWRGYRRELKLLHEYIADAVILKEKGMENYFNALLQATFRLPDYQFVNSFFTHNHLKRRIMMHQKNISVKHATAKWILAGVAVLFVLAGINACKNSMPPVNENVIDAQKFGELLAHRQIKRLDIKNPPKVIITTKDGRTFVYYRKDQQSPKTVVSHERSHLTATKETKTTPDCQIVDNQSLRQCLNERIKDALSNRFDWSVLRTGGEPGDILKMIAVFRIGRDGRLQDIRIKDAPSEAIKDELVKAFESIPPLTDAARLDQAEELRFSIPLLLRVK